MRAPTVRYAQQLTEDDFTNQDVTEFHQLMTELLTACRAAADKHAPKGVWETPASDLFSQFSESMAVIADVSRALNQTRGGIRRIGSRARQRLYDRAVGPAEHPQPDQEPARTALGATRLRP